MTGRQIQSLEALALYLPAQRPEAVSNFSERGVLVHTHTHKE